LKGEKSMNVQVLSDQKLLNSYLSGDQRAISKLIERYSRRVRDYINMMVKDRDVADDIFQETFIKAVRVIDDGRYTDNGKFLSWILRIAHNQVIDHFRAQKQSRQVTEAEAGYDVLGTLRFAERTVEDELVSSQIENDVRRLVELLPDEQREVVMMRYYGGLSFKEIAEQTDVSINTALGRMRYALINLRRMIKEKNLVLC
jgi:RNA polymerase sigma factor, sigma-70 family